MHTATRETIDICSVRSVNPFEYTGLVDRKDADNPSVVFYGPLQYWVYKHIKPNHRFARMTAQSSGYGALRNLTVIKSDYEDLYSGQSDNTDYQLMEDAVMYSFFKNDDCSHFKEEMKDDGIISGKDVEFVYHRTSDDTDLSCYILELYARALTALINQSSVFSAQVQ